MTSADTIAGDMAPMPTGNAGTFQHEQPLHIGAGHPAFEGHFPGAPILPGVALLAAVLEAAQASAVLRACIGGQPQLGVVKFTGMVAPETSLTIRFQAGPRMLAWQIGDGPRLVASGDFVRADLATAAA